MRFTSRRVALTTALAGLVLAAQIVTQQSTVEAATLSVGTVSFADGQVLRARAKSQSFNRIKRGSTLYQGDTIKTKSKTKFEAKLKDGSMLRLGANSHLQLQELSFDRKQPRKKKKVRAKLYFGRVWASVTSLFGSDSSFEVETRNAVAGVRGTKFTATTTEAGDTTVRVYSGKVLVSNEPIYKVEGATKENRKEVAGPQEITKDAWEKLLAEAMQLVRVSASGDLGDAESFAMGATPEDAEWEAWNAKRDELAGFRE